MTYTIGLLLAIVGSAIAGWSIESFWAGTCVVVLLTIGGMLVGFSLGAAQ